MNAEEIKQLVIETVKQVEISKTLLITVLPVILTIATNTIYDIIRRRSESKRKFYLKKLDELYLPLYTIIAQSEYIRYFFQMKQPFDEIPFSEIEKNNKEVKYNGVKVTVSESIVEDGITSFNKKAIVKLIIDKNNYASTKLIKLAVAHRYLEDNYLNKITNQKIANKFSEDELKVLAELVKTIVRETNRYLKYCSMEYDKKELKKGILNPKVYIKLDKKKKRRNEESAE